ncbi:hypothetical protein SprV_0100008100 [Sparganum proliferum]
MSLDQFEERLHTDSFVRHWLVAVAGCMLGSRIHEHKLAVRRGDELLQLAAHTYEMDRELNFSVTKIVTHTGNKTGRELVEAWVSGENSVNRFIDLTPAYGAPRSHLQSCAIGR